MVHSCVLLIVSLFAASEASRDPPPVIALELDEGIIEPIYIHSDGVVCHTPEQWLQMGNLSEAKLAPETCKPHVGGQTKRGYSKRCNVLTDTKDSCKEPRATAFDHHQGNLDVKKEVVLLVKSDPQEQPMKTHDILKDVDYTQRGEFLLKYSAEDASGNKAESVVFVMIMVDTVPPMVSTLLPSELSVESCDVDQKHIDSVNRMLFNIPKSVRADDNYDGDVSSLVRLSIDKVLSHDASQGPLLVAETVGKIQINTKTLGRRILTFVAHDYANIFGLDNKDNVKTLRTRIDVKDSIAPLIYCRHDSYRTKSGAFSLEPLAIRIAQNVPQCAEACEQQQWSRIVGSVQNPEQCRAFQYDMITKACKLFGEAGEKYFGLSSSSADEGHIVQGLLVQCDEINQHECSAGSFKDPGAICVDMRDSLTDDGKIVDSALKVHAKRTATVDGMFTITYGCEDTSGNVATPVSRTVTVKDTSKPEITIHGNLIQQTICGSDSNSHVVEAFSTLGKGYTAQDPCAGGLGEEKCRHTIYRDTCAGQYTCADEYGSSMECNGGSREVVNKSVILTPGTWAMKYTCEDFNGNSVSRCRTIINVDSEDCLASRVSATRSPTRTPTLSPTLRVFPTPAPTPLLINCSMSRWQPWGACSEKCGSGVQQRRRSVQILPLNGGKPCPVEQESRACNIHPCPLDCVSEWLPWNSCSQSCGGGVQFREVKIIQNAGDGGRQCPLAQQRVCNPLPCPEDCVVSEWGSWQSCSVTCGTGSQTRFRYEVKNALFGGKPCPSIIDRRQCERVACPVDCVVSTWSVWSPCSQICAGGTQVRKRDALSPRVQNGLRCPVLQEIRNCNMDSCARECHREKGAWAPWSPCTKTCGNGVQVRRFGGDDKSTSERQESCPSGSQRVCNAQPCPVNCDCSAWSEWEFCTRSCGGGSQIRNRQTITPDSFGGRTCPTLVEYRICNMHECPQDCVVSTWSIWDNCSVECGGGIQSRKRFVESKASAGGKQCGALFQTQNCNPRPCGVNCEYSFGSWTPCSRTCGAGSQSRGIRVKTNAVGCPAQHDEHRICNTDVCPSDCIVSGWRQWSSCSTTCESLAGSMRTRARDVLRPPVAGGRACPALHEKQHCSQKMCPIDCEVSVWADWGRCSQICGSGIQRRIRTILVAPEHEGLKCPATEDTRICNSKKCAVDCVHEWLEWSPCSKSCGTGTQVRGLLVTTYATAGGKDCPPAEDRVCNVTPCPVDCVVSHWMEWTRCSKTCGAGLTKRGRAVVRPAQFGGRLCPVLTESKDCFGSFCPTDCAVSSWSGWAKCSEFCGGGIQKRTRSVRLFESNGGVPCPALTETQQCSTQNCPVDCKHEWKAWSSCSKTCNAGIRVRKARVIRHAAYGGSLCPSSEEQVCNTKLCPVDCEVTEWGVWGACSKSCGMGYQERLRDIERLPTGGGAPCGVLRESAECKNDPCPVDCTVSTWSTWSPCSKTCGRGSSRRSRDALRATQAGGKSCPTLVDFQDCSESACPRDCEISSWNQWGECSVACGQGVQKRFRHVVLEPVNFGIPCPHLMDAKNCQVRPCPVDCEFKWTGWTPCSASCGTGMQQRSPVIFKHQMHGGAACPMKEDRVCNTASCPQNCLLSSWSQWEVCSKTCGAAVQKRERFVIVHPLAGGRLCQLLTEARNCNTQLCPFDCVVSSWSEWTTCSQTCNGGSQARMRNVVADVMEGGKACPPTVSYRKCNIRSCPVNCVVGHWSHWTDCSQPCGGGIQKRHRNVVQGRAFGGLDCSFLHQVKECNVNRCGDQCQATVAGPWSPCSRSCGGGVKIRNLRPYSNSTQAAQCPELQEEVCNASPCPVDCVLSPWDAWRPCSKICGGGSQTRSRLISVETAFGGKNCSALVESSLCNTNDCPSDCKVSPWSNKHRCTATCGGGIATRTRTVIEENSREGKACPTLQASASCNTQSCPVDCVVSQWGDWVECSVECGEGVQSRVRTLVTGYAFGGKACPRLEDVRNCKTKPCYSQCAVHYTEWTKCTKSCGQGMQSKQLREETSNTTQICPPSLDRICNSQPCPADCVLSTWAAWEDCSVTCGAGSQTRSRLVLSAATNGGLNCSSHLQEHRDCRGNNCPIDCLVSVWSDWSECSEKCGGGLQLRTRVISQASAYLGRKCPSTAQHRTCNTTSCSGLCDLIYGEWEPCSKSCGGGQQIRRELISAHSDQHALHCPTTQAKLCNTSPCPNDCIASEWQAWSPCSASCKGGVRSRSREALQGATFGGKACSGMVEVQACGGQHCPVDCLVSSWSPWNQCSQACGAGTRTRSRVIIVSNSMGGRTCPHLVGTGLCNTEPCPCTFLWTNWTVCSQTCGGGMQKRIVRTTKSSSNDSSNNPCPLSQHRVCNPSPCPFDCIVSSWTKWSFCSKVCGAGVATRHKNVIRANTYGGKKCPVLSERKNCNTQGCPTDCQTSMWSSWSLCSHDCGSGVQTRQRSVIVHATFGGLACPRLEEVQNCNTRPCPTHCKFEVTKWTSCSRSCGIGVQTRNTTITIRASNGGADCPPDQSRTCNIRLCPIDCSVTDWSTWGTCSKTCGRGLQHRMRQVVVQPQHGGLKCPAQVETQPCNTNPCGVDCVTSPWGSWGECTKSCSSGFHARFRKILVPVENGGKKCPVLSERKNCNTQGCPTDCQTSMWSSWSLCSHDCGSGVQTRQRSVIVHATFGGLACPRLEEVQNCNTRPCPTHCKFEVTKWTSCSRSCGIGVQTRNTTITIRASNGGADCPPDQSRTCNIRLCPIDCSVTDWSTWGTCSKTCGRGLQHRMRQVVVQPQHGGLKCPAQVETQPCNTNPCGVDCVTSPWGSWGECSKSCGLGQAIRRRTVVTRMRLGGRRCPHLSESSVCNEDSCPTGCVTGRWGEWNACSQVCGGGIQVRARAIIIMPSRDGDSCPPVTEARNCNSHECPMHCDFEFSSWSPCSQSCGTGTQTRSATVLDGESFGGRACPTVEDRLCSTSPCPIDCVVHPWNAWTACSKTCGDGMRHRTRYISSIQLFGGRNCPHSTEKATCNSFPCPQSCTVSEWQSWGPCSTPCGQGVRNRYRSVVSSAAYDGLACPSLMQIDACTVKPCAMDCILSYHPWGRCSTSCGGGIQSRTVVSNSRFPEYGIACPKSQDRLCNAFPCPINCKLSQWTIWSTCSQTCGMGHSTRARTILVSAAFEGKFCPSIRESRHCNPFPCPTDCVVSEWGKWLDCSSSCDSGSQFRLRKTLTEPSVGGRACPFLSQKRSCNQHGCPVDCEVSAWTEFGACSVLCGNGVQLRSRKIQISSAMDGAPCPSLASHRNCVGHKCSADCQPIPWSDWDACSMTCGGGIQARRASSSKQQTCPHTEQRICMSQPCPVDCRVSPWGSWSQCRHSCGVADASRARLVIRKPIFGGRSCPSLTQLRSCALPACPVGCSVTEWVPWSLCSRTCSGGQQSRTRRIIAIARSGGASCPPLTETRACNTVNCAVDCRVTGWSDWSMCSRTCALGSRARTRSILQIAKYGGKSCPFVIEHARCATQACPIDCHFSDWSKHSSCSQLKCGGGVSLRTRTVLRRSSAGGRPCPPDDSLLEAVPCNTAPCSTECELLFTDWGACTKLCGAGKQARTLLKSTSHQRSHVCPSRQERVCNSQLCPADCAVSPFNEWGSCSTSCGSGFAQRTRRVLIQAAMGGKSCPPLSEQQTCNSASCPRDCKLSKWGAWGSCSKSCGGGTKSRFNRILVPSIYGGLPCGALVQTIQCNPIECAQSCVVSSWRSWGSCSKECGGGTKSRVRLVSRPSFLGGRPCPSLSQSMSCGDAPCPVPCQVSSWSTWSTCSTKCGGGITSRSRDVVVGAAHGGQPCPLLRTTKECNSNPCPGDCSRQAWGSWTACTRSCGVGSSSRSIILRDQPMSDANTTCPTVESSTCNVQPCPSDCLTFPFGPWSRCSTTCGEGTQYRSRQIVQLASVGGKGCPVLYENMPCTPIPCPVDCLISGWSEWGSCSTTCGSGSQQRQRTVQQEGSFRGESCPELTETRSCSGRACPESCVLSSWSHWSACSKTCGASARTRSRRVLKYPAYNALPCGALVDAEDCAESHCPVNCETSTWSQWGSCSRSCGQAIQTRTRSVTKTRQFFGRSCPPLQESRTCKLPLCSEDCSSEWNSWTACSVSCGGGIKIRTRKVGVMFGFSSCPHMERAVCQTQPCPVDCEVSEWDEWSMLCSKTCGTGTRSRMRYVLTLPKDGLPCPELRQAQLCNIHPCPNDCAVSAWSPWSRCAVTCGSGQHSRTRSIILVPIHGGKSCPGLSEKRGCSQQLCPVDCATSAWSTWTQCSKSCGLSVRKRTRMVTMMNIANGLYCPELHQAARCLASHCDERCDTEWNEWEACSKSCGMGSQKRAARSNTKGVKNCPTTEERLCNTQPCAIDCVVLAWAPWSLCTKTCGAGITYRTRQISIPSAHGGFGCPTLSESKLCHSDPCPVDCKVSSWSTWSECSAECGIGIRVRSRAIVVDTRHHGFGCPDLQDAELCNEHPCPVDCMYSWDDWSICSRSCGAGQQAREVIKHNEAAYGGKFCPSAQARICNIQHCPMDCVVSSWSQWDVCSKTCSGGTQSRVRRVVLESIFGGRACPTLEERKECAQQSCPQDCRQSSWGNWNPCSEACGGGVHTRSRTIISNGRFGGEACKDTEQEKNCNSFPCPIDCVHRWGAWSVCSRTCNGGTQIRTPIILSSAQHGGKCPDAEERTCSQKACPVDCLTSTWAQWSECSATCATGFQERKRSILVTPAFGGVICPTLLDKQDCIRENCPIHCEVSSWSKWTSCSQSCGGGTQTRSRVVVRVALHGGKPCPLLSKQQMCEDKPCPVDCIVSEWSKWGACSEKCGGGIAKRVRMVLKARVHRGAPCPMLIDAKDCNPDPCPVDCEFIWMTWTACSRSCGAGTQQRTVTMKSAAKHGGLDCPSVEERTCQVQDCPEDCSVSPWTSWSSCLKTCGHDYQSRSRVVTNTPQHGGKLCPVLKHGKSCNNVICSTDCIAGTWSPWSSCSATCGSGVHGRTRLTVTQPAHGGQRCPPLVETSLCNSEACPINCQVSQWSELSTCSQICGDGVQTRERTVILQAAYGGIPCPMLQQYFTCDSKPCPKDCVLSWGPWSSCSRSCGTGLQNRRAEVLKNGQNSRTCQTVIETICNSHACPFDCAVSTWSAWTSCSQTCNTGFRTQSRSVTVEASEGGKACPELTKTARCNTQGCPIDCRVSPWSDWTPCSQECDGGIQNRRRFVTTINAHDGIPCPATVENKDCHTHPCSIKCLFNEWLTCSRSCGGGTQHRTIVHGSPTFCPPHEERTCKNEPCANDCIVSEWDEWSACSQSCDEGYTFRRRDIVLEATEGGKHCPVVVERKTCWNKLCPLDCTVSSWGNWNECSQPCGTGVQSRLRQILSFDKNGGRPCPMIRVMRRCHVHDCPTDCDSLAWGPWSSCSKTCGGGFQRRSHLPVAVGGKDVQHTPGLCANYQDRLCNTDGCTVDCSVSWWSSWSPCTTTCGQGTRQRSRAVSIAPGRNGKTCPALKEEGACNGEPCPTDCQVSEWGEFDDCSAVCGGGMQIRTRTITANDMHGGLPCPPIRNMRECNLHHCPAYCSNSWMAWTACSATCGGGTMTRPVTNILEAQKRGPECPLLQTKLCNSQPCSTDCRVSSWSNWESCSKSCGMGTRLRFRRVVVEGTYGGTSCPSLTETGVCHMSFCPIDCAVAQWHADTRCSKTCGSGMERVSRAVLMEARHGGRTCPPTSMWRACNTQDCPVDCLVSEWGLWERCSTPCGVGVQLRTRQVVSQPGFGGRECPSLEQWRDCVQLPKCRVTCEDEWQMWSPCDKSCGGGISQRMVVVTQEPAVGGIDCPTVQKRTCNTMICPTQPPTPVTSSPTTAPTMPRPAPQVMTIVFKITIRSTAAFDEEEQLALRQSIANSAEVTAQQVLLDLSPYTGSVTRRLSQVVSDGALFVGNVVIKFPSSQYNGIEQAHAFALHTYNLVKMGMFTQRVQQQFNIAARNFGLEVYLPSGAINLNSASVQLSGVRSEIVTLLPVINIVNNDFLTLEATTQQFYTDSGATCSDQHEGDISARVVVSGAIYPDARVTGSYKLDYDCANAHGQYARTATRNVLVRDTRCPVCRLNPGIDTIEASFPFVDAGAVCSDSLDGAIRDVVVTSDVNVEQTGDYYVTYKARDNAGNWNDGACKESRTYVRHVRVIDTLKPVVALHYRGQIVSPSAKEDTSIEFGDRVLLAEPSPGAAQQSWVAAAGMCVFSLGFTLVAAARFRTSPTPTPSGVQV